MNRHPRKRVTFAAVRHILTTDAPIAQLARETGLSPSLVGYYKRLDLVAARDVADFLRAKGEKVFTSRARYTRRDRLFTAEQVRSIRASDASSYKLARTYGVSPSLIRMIRSRRIYTDV